MRRIAVDALQPAPALARALLHESGALLFTSGERVGDEEIALLRRCGVRRVYDLGGPEVEPPGSGSEGTGPLEQREPAVVPDEVRLFRRERRAATVRRAIERAAAARLGDGRLCLDPRGELRDGGVDRALARSREGEMPEGAPWRERLEELRPEVPRERAERAAALETRRSVLARLTELFDGLRAGAAPPDVTPIVRDLFSLAARDPELALACALDRSGEPGGEAGAEGSPSPGGAHATEIAAALLARHSVDVATYALATAIELGYSLEQLFEIAHAALLHDVGMVRLPEALARKPAALDDEERRELERHPLHALEVLRRFAEVPVAVAAVALEEHERPDGSGYPRGAGAEPGEFARIVATADVFDALASPRPHRPARPPHAAVRELVALAARRKLDPKVLRAFLKAAALFPVGSVLRLSDGALARVVRPGGPDAARPVVALLEGGGGLVDLAQRADLKVAEADVAWTAPEGDPLQGF